MHQVVIPKKKERAPKQKKLYARIVHQKENPPIKVVIPKATCKHKVRLELTIE